MTSHRKVIVEKSFLQCTFRAKEATMPFCTSHGCLGTG